MVALLLAVGLLLEYRVEGIEYLAAAQGRFYPQTKHTLDASFVSFFDSHGGVTLLGYPITEARDEGGYLAQWTERERLEWHPEYRGSDAEVLLGLLGRELTGYLHGPNFTARSVSVQGGGPGAGSFGGSGPGETQFFPETGQAVGEPFLSYWRRNGGLAVFGYPISALFTDDQGLQVQWFERARFELHPELPEQFRVSLGLLGVESRNEMGIETAEIEVVNSSPSGNPLQIGLAQGGESDSPAFFDNIRQAGAGLGPGLVRLDNIYNFYHIVSRGEDGALLYNWAELDRVIATLRAMGKEPFICLSYMPEILSRSGNSRVEPPASYEEWAALVGATVAHLNGISDFGFRISDFGMEAANPKSEIRNPKSKVRYWEVWNEPNQWDFWRGSFADYLRLYDVTVDAALAVDPTIHIGGPAFSSFEPNGLNEFLQHEAEMGDKGRVDFVSWHAYGQTPYTLGEQIRKVRAIVGQYPQFRPELFITEFNVSQGGSGDTSADGVADRVEGAISLLRSIEVMQRERLDRAFLFELKDGANPRGPSRYWGRWGVLTNDGQPKPVYHALKAYLNRPTDCGLPVAGCGTETTKPKSEIRLPIIVKRGPTDGTLGFLAYGDPERSLLLLWYSGKAHRRVKIAMPNEFAGVDYDAALFDDTHNNPARSGDATLRMSPTRSAGDLVFEVKPNTLLILTSTR